MVKILMVCLGNICRSPLAQGILEQKLPSNDFFVDSAGTSSYHIGSPPDPRSIRVARKYGIDISHYRAYQLQQSDFESFDLIYVMDANNYSDASKMVTSQHHLKKIHLITDEIVSKKISAIPDPYYGGKDGFEMVYTLLNEACSRISNRLQYG